VIREKGVLRVEGHTSKLWRKSKLFRGGGRQNKPFGGGLERNKV